MRVCFVTYLGREGQGGNTVVREYARFFRDRSDEVTIAIESDRQEYERQIPGVVVTRCGRVSRIKRLTQLSFIHCTARLIRELEFDVVHVFYFTGAGLLPLLCQGRGRWVLNVQSGRTGGDFKARLYDRLMFVESFAFDAILVIGEQLRKKLYGRWLVDRTAITRQGVDLRRFGDARPDRAVWTQYGVDPNSTVLVYLGSLHPSRKLEILVEAFSRVVQSLVGARLSLAFIGGTPEEKQRLEKVATKHGVRRQVRFTGFVDHELVPSLLASADLGLGYVPITYGYDVQPPLKTLEYLAASLPVVATRTAAHQELLVNGLSILLCDDTPDAYARGVNSILTDDGLRSRMKKTARRSVIGYDWHAVCNDALKTLVGTP